MLFSWLLVLSQLHRAVKRCIPFNNGLALDPNYSHMMGKFRMLRGEAQNESNECLDVYAGTVLVVKIFEEHAHVANIGKHHTFAQNLHLSNSMNE